MKERDVENTLKDLAAPAPDPMARLRAKRAALAEFARAQSPNNLQIDASQENDVAARLSREPTSGSTSMKRFANRNWYAAAAGLGVLAIGLTWVLPNLDRYHEELESPQLASSQPPVDVGTEAAALPGGGNRPPAEQDSNANSSAPPAAAAMSEEAEQRSRKDEAYRAQAAAEGRAKEQRADESQQRAQGPAAQPAAQPAEVVPAPVQNEEVDEVVVTGLRQAVQQAQVSRSVVVAADAITAEDVGRMPDKRTAEPLQRVPAPAAPPPPSAKIIAGSSPVGFAGGAIANTVEYVEQGRDQFEHFDVNPVRQVATDPVSTFSADVDTASYSFMRGLLNRGVLPPKDAVRSEEMINYFSYAWPAADSRRAPFKPTVVVGDSPWNKGKKLVHIGIKGYELERDEAPDANLMLLLDVSGSMNAPNKLPLAVRSMELLLESLKPGDTVGIVVYAGAAGTVLEPTPVREKEKILEALHALRPGGSTAGAAGIERAYQLAEAHFRKGGVNRILLATDGDFNVGIAGTEELKGFVERKREKGIYLSVLGYGQGNYRDELAQALAQNGNGVAAYIDSESEARKVLVREASSSLFTIAKDVKLQVEFNPATVSEYRLVGYETRALKREDFNNDAVDAGDVGAGHTVTAIYEITPVGSESLSIDAPRYPGNAAKAPDKEARGSRDEYGFLKIRYKLPGEESSRLISEPIPLRAGKASSVVARDVAFSTAVAGFAQLLRGGTHTGSLGYDDVLRQAQDARGDDRFGDRAEFIELVRRARQARGM